MNRISLISKINTIQMNLDTFGDPIYLGSVYWYQDYFTICLCLTNGARGRISIKVIKAFKHDLSRNIFYSSRLSVWNL